VGGGSGFGAGGDGFWCREEGFDLQRGLGGSWFWCLGI
jgi:hypothetical protein